MLDLAVGLGILVTAAFAQSSAPPPIETLVLASQAAGGCRGDGLIFECGRLLAWSHCSANSICGMVGGRPRRRVAGWSRASYCFDHRPRDQEYRHSKDLNGAGSDLSKPFHGSLALAVEVA